MLRAGLLLGDPQAPVVLLFGPPHHRVQPLGWQRWPFPWLRRGLWGVCRGQPGRLAWGL